MNILDDLLVRNWGPYIDNFTMVDLYELWVNIKNKEGFQYTLNQGSKNEKTYTAPIYYYNTNPHV